MNATEFRSGTGTDYREPGTTVEERLERIEELLTILVERQAVKEYYTTEEFARMVGKAEFTVREYCRLGRLQAVKQGTGRGRFFTWAIPHAEYLRFQKDGLLPEARRA